MVRYYDGERSAVGSVDMARPLREFHLTEDLNTQWANQERFTVPLATYFARTVGMTTEESGTVPLLVAERDTLAPQPNCELEKVGQLLFDKYEKLVDTDPDLATMFLLQAAKFKPELAQKHWGGDALKTLKDVLGADDAQEQVSTTARGRRLWLGYCCSHRWCCVAGVGMHHAGRVGRAVHERRGAGGGGRGGGGVRAWVEQHGLHAARAAGGPGRAPAVAEGAALGDVPVAHQVGVRRLPGPPPRHLLFRVRLPIPPASSPL